MPSKLTFLISTLGGGGAERVCVLLANGLARKGWDVEVVVMKDLPQSRKATLDDEVTFTVLGVSRARYSPFQLFRYIIHARPSLILTMSNETAMPLAMISFLMPLKKRWVHRCITTLSGLVKRTGDNHRAEIRYAMLKFAICRCSLIVNQCHAMELDTKRELGSSAPLNKFIYNPVEIGASDSVNINGGSPYGLLVGRLDKNKSFDLAINALSLLSETHDRVELWIAGDGPLKAALLNLASELGISNRVRFLGYRTDLSVLYKQAAFVALTSNFEGFPNVLLEAISYGTPIVSVDCPNGPAEIVEEGVNGFLVEERSPEKLCQAFEWALEFDWDKSLIKKSAERFSEEKIISEWDDLLAGMLGNSKVKNA